MVGVEQKATYKDGLLLLSEGDEDSKPAPLSERQNDELKNTKKKNPDKPLLN